jgi:hypothetical protein
MRKLTSSAVVFQTIQYGVFGASVGQPVSGSVLMAFATTGVDADEQRASLLGSRASV